jgi:hypothetical protein
MSNQSFEHHQKFNTGWMRGSVVTASKDLPPGDNWIKCKLHVYHNNPYTSMKLTEETIEADRYAGPKKRKNDGTDEFFIYNSLYLQASTNQLTLSNPEALSKMLRNLLDRNGFSHLTTSGHFISIKKILNTYIKKNNRIDAKGESARIIAIVRLPGPVYQVTFMTKSGSFWKNFAVVPSDHIQDSCWGYAMERIWMEHHFGKKLWTETISCDYEVLLDYRMIPNDGRNDFYLDNIRVDTETSNMPQDVLDYIKILDVKKVIDG